MSFGANPIDWNLFKHKLTNCLRTAKAKSSVPVQIKSERTREKRKKVCYLKSIYIFSGKSLIMKIGSVTLKREIFQSVEGRVISFQSGRCCFSANYSIIEWAPDRSLRGWRDSSNIYSFTLAFISHLLFCWFICLFCAPTHHSKQLCAPLFVKVTLACGSLYLKFLRILKYHSFVLYKLYVKTIRLRLRNTNISSTIYDHY